MRSTPTVSRDRLTIGAAALLVAAGFALVTAPPTYATSLRVKATDPAAAFTFARPTIERCFGAAAATSTPSPQNAVARVDVTFRHANVCDERILMVSTIDDSGNLVRSQVAVKPGASSVTVVMPANSVDTTKNPQTFTESR